MTATKKTILQKLQEARDIIKQSDLKKAGTNEYSKYDYYTPEQVEALVEKACKETGTICLCNLKADEFGLYQELVFIDINDSENSILFQLRTKHGSLKATNETQQMGGTDTYSERYIKMKVFQIKDNNLDCDSQDNRQSAEKNTPKCSICGKPMFTSKKGNLVCPDWMKHKENNAGRSEPIYSKIQDKVNKNKKDFMNDLSYQDELDATEKVEKFDNVKIKK